MSTTTPIKIGLSMSLTGPLAANGQTAFLAQKIWEEDVNRKGGILGRPVQLVCLDDRTDPAVVAENYQRLLDVEKVDLIVGGYGNNSMTPAMPLVVERQRYFVGLMGLGVNIKFKYPNYFVMIPTGPNPSSALTEGFFDLAALQKPRPVTVGIVAADADFSRNPIAGARENAAKHHLRVISERKYPLSTNDFAPLIREVAAEKPDVLFLCSYLNDSIGLVRAITGIGFQPKMVGGAMIGPQSSSVKCTLGPLLNGFINYEYWLPVPRMMYPGVKELIEKYQDRATAVGADALGYYVAPQAYAQMQVLEQAVVATQGLEDATLAHYTREAVFRTVVGDVKFGAGGEWAEPRVLQVQFQNIRGYELEQFKGSTTRTVVAPREFEAGELIYPYSNAMK